MKMEIEYKRLRWLILIVGVLALISSTSFTLTMAAWGMGNKTYIYLALYPLLIVALTLVAFNVKVGYLTTCFIACSYIVLLSGSVIEYVLYNIKNLVLIPIVVLPFLLYLILVPLTIRMLMWRSNNRKLVYRLSVTIVMMFTVYICSGMIYNKADCNLYADATIKSDGTIRIVCKPGFGDAREFYITSKSRELVKMFKDKGELYQGTWNADVQGVGTVVMGRLQTFTITHINEIELKSPLEWNAGQLIGDTTFILP
ncbi:hypothetical protein [Pedobacter heparinus]|uniref:hypothetical protein n=1 Tax=Pedobacter heparinus TaxID=984 RepID=UPI00292CB456|nr:hypothetical protein [Pedobacter heparinus]